MWVEGVEVDRFLRSYEIPGFGHGSATVFNARLDALSLLAARVERDDDPAQKAAVTDAAHGGRTRPLCLYPNWPRYKGAGNPGIATSFLWLSIKAFARRSQ
jgi:feruloyl esterase